MNKLYIIFLLLIFSNCKNETPSRKDGMQAQNSKNTTPLFDLKGFLDNEIATHLKDVKKVKKTVTVNGKTESKEVEIKDWKEELKPFFNSDINRPAWRDKYKVDTIVEGSYPTGEILNNDSIITITNGKVVSYVGEVNVGSGSYSRDIIYASLDKNLKTKKITRFYKDLNYSSVVRTETAGFIIENDESSVIGTSKQTMKFTTQKQYSIESIQTSFLGNKDTIIISVEY
jgi:hypothetical protein